MSTAVFHRRRIERFARLLDEAAGPGSRHARIDATDDLAHFAVLCRRVTTIPLAAAPTDQFRDSLRAMLVATAERDGLGRTHHREAAARPALATAASGWRSSRTRGAILVGVAAGAVALSGMSTASNGALPGDPLYGVKRSTERAQLALAGSGISRGQLYLEFAQTRLTEAKAVRADADQLTSVLTDMDSETRLGVKLLTTAAVEQRDTTALDAVDRFADTQRTDLFEAVRTFTEAAIPEGRQSLSLLDQISHRVDQLRAAMTCTAKPASGADGIGPLPAGCPSGTLPAPVPGAGSTPTPTASPSTRRAPAPGAATTTPAGPPVPPSRTAVTPPPPSPSPTSAPSPAEPPPDPTP